MGFYKFFIISLLHIKFRILFSCSKKSPITFYRNYKGIVKASLYSIRFFQLGTGYISPIFQIFFFFCLTVEFYHFLQLGLKQLLPS